MRIVKIEDLNCNAGWRDFSLLKITAGTICDFSNEDRQAAGRRRRIRRRPMTAGSSLREGASRRRHRR
jgi:hypothetical protein